MRRFALIFLLCILKNCGSTTSSNARFLVDGPSVTVTLNDSDNKNSWVDGLRPSFYCSVRSNGPPVPSIPNLKRISLAMEGQKKNVQVDAAGCLQFGRCELQIQAAYKRQQPTHLVLKLLHGRTFGLVNFSRKRLEYVAGQYQTTVGRVGLSIEPGFHVNTRDWYCRLEALTGRTKAILDLQYMQPSLAIQYKPNESNLLRPEIDLYSGKMKYQWITRLRRGTLRTTVDPSEALEWTWTDGSSSGCWVTDIRFPLNKAPASLRVRRLFRF